VIDAEARQAIERKRGDCTCVDDGIVLMMRNP